MALFSSSQCKFPISAMKFHRNSTITKPFSPLTLRSAIPIYESKLSISAANSRSNPNLQRLQCYTSSSAQIDSDASFSTIVFIKGLPQSTSEGRLKTVFSQFGEVCRVKIVTDKKTKRSLGFAYVWFNGEDFAQVAVKEMNGKFLDGKFVSVSMAKPGSCKSRVKATPYKF